MLDARYVREELERGQGREELRHFATSHRSLGHCGYVPDAAYCVSMLSLSYSAYCTYCSNLATIAREIYIMDNVETACINKEVVIMFSLSLLIIIRDSCFSSGIPCADGESKGPVTSASFMSD